jgi:hypothetical protein
MPDLCIFIRLRTAQYRGGIFSPFMQMYFNMRSFDLSPSQSIQYHSHLSIAFATPITGWLLLVRRKLPQTHWLLVLSQ